MSDQQIIFMIIGGSALAMLLLGGGIIGLFLYNRPKVLRRRRIEQIGHLNGGENGSSDKAETRRQKRIREKVKQLEDSGDKKSWIDAIRELILQAGLDLSVSTYFIISGVVGVFSAFGALAGGRYEDAGSAMRAMSRSGGINRPDPEAVAKHLDRYGVFKQLQAIAATAVS